MLAVQAIHPIDTDFLATCSRNGLLHRKGIFESFFAAEPPRLAKACQMMSRRFLATGRLKSSVGCWNEVV